MSNEKAPAYQWFVKDWRSSRATMRMSMAERGVYREMLDEQWESLSLPDSAEDVADLLAGTDTQRAEVLAAWGVVRRKFAEVEGQPGRIVNLRLERVRKERRRFVRTAQKGGRARADQAARSASGTFQPTSSLSASRVPATQPAVAPSSNQPTTSTASATATASSSATATATAKSRAAGAPPLALGLRRLKIWRWMIDEFIDRLGEHAESFDLDAWIQQQDQTEQRAIGGEWGVYWTTAFDAEVRRRGIPLASSSDRKPLFSTTVQQDSEAVLAILHGQGGVPR
jgi:uncharacterized protein YdaU (DUF1376 family)